MEITLVKPAYAQDLSTFYAPGRALGPNVTLGQLITPLVQNFTIITGLLSFGVLVFAGLQYIMASGDTARIEQAQRMMTYAIIGLVLSVTAFWITRILITVLGGNF